MLISPLLSDHIYLIIGQKIYRQMFPLLEAEEHFGKVFLPNLSSKYILKSLRLWAELH